ncbi:MAG: acetolactate synthase [Deltaproteobacteria bacterium]|nr:acetolactate synthase [Deltaproteobacteria bacterium]
MARLHGGRVVARALRAEGVSHLFTLCGGHIQAIYDGCLDEGIRVVDFRHEQSAAHAADGWARVTGRPGVAAVTAGPGVTDAVTAVANAQRAQIPMVLVGGQGARLLGPLGGQDRGGLQDMNHVELLRAVSKWSVSVPETRRLGEYVQTAFRVATSGVPGPVFLEMPLDVLMGGCEDAEAVAYEGYRTEARPMGDPEHVERASALIRGAEHPLLIVGSQWRWSKHPQALARFLDAVPMPAFLNGLARGALPPDHRCYLKHARSKALSRSDCVIVFGTPLDFRLGYGDKIPPTAKVIQVDLDGAEIGRNRKVDVGIVGDTGHVLGQLAGALDGCPGWSAWLGEVQGIESELVAKIRAECAQESDPINPLRLCAEVNHFVDPKTIVVGDGGDFVATAAYVLDVEGPGSWMDPGPLGTLGVGPGYAMAAKLALPEHQVVIMFGDGSFGLNGMEFEAMARQGIKVVGIVGNDACWTQIYRGQSMIYGPTRTPATRLSYTRYDKVVEGLGGHGEYVERPNQLRPALERAFAADKPALVNVKMGQSDFRRYAVSV